MNNKEFKIIKPEIIDAIKLYNFDNIHPLYINKKTIVLNLDQLTIHKNGIKYDIYVNVHLNKSSSIKIQRYVYVLEWNVATCQQYSFRLPKDLDQYLKLKFL